MKKYLLIVLFIVCVAILVGFLVMGNKGKEDNDNKVGQNKTTNISTNLNNTNNVKINNNIDQSSNVNEVDKNEIENNVKEAIENLTNSINSQIENKNTTESTIPAESQQLNSEAEDPNVEKAISIAKQEWGEDDSVYYTNEGKNGEYYLVGVRDKSTTSVQLYYKVDINNNTAEIEW